MSGPGHVDGGWNSGRGLAPMKLFTFTKMRSFISIERYASSRFGVSELNSLRDRSTIDRFLGRILSVFLPSGDVNEALAH